MLPRGNISPIIGKGIAMFSMWAYPLLLMISLIVNVPLGFIREGTAKFSGKWFLWVHASIPLLIYLRLKWEVSPWLIPFIIGFAVVGQMSGGRWRRSQMTIEDEEELAQIDDANLLIPTEADRQAEDKNTMVVLMNMGGPRVNEEVPVFLKRLFSDDLILRVPFSKVLQPLFATMIVKARAKATQERYQLIGGGSPICPSTAKQAGALRDELKRRGRANIEVTFSFNYSSPFPDETIGKIKNLRKEFVLPLSLYPHYSKATTGSNIFYLKQAAEKLYPELKFLTPPDYHLADGYIQAFVDRILEQVKPGESLEDFYILFSVHGLPLYFLVEGDLYPHKVSQTVAAILRKLNRTDRWTVSYQSAVGPLQWLKPDTEQMIRALARRQQLRMIVVPVSFVTDHIETLCEIDMEYRHIAKGLGITDFRMTKAIECHPAFIGTLADCVEKAIARRQNTVHVE